tara:strand:+ start:1717 stop:2778 length:1062 start_codon:yes stop_codon:yes gene_type:complete
MHNLDNLNKKKILVTGGAGFIGSAVIRKLLRETSSFIFNIDKLTYASDLTSIERTLRDLGGNSAQRYSFYKLDLLNEKEINQLLQNISPDIIMHLAAESHVDRSIDGPKIFMQSNIMGTFNLLNAALKYYYELSSYKKKDFLFHHISTDEVFGTLGEEGFFDEYTPYNPRSPYSASKASSDLIVNAWHHTYDLPIIISNCSNNYGPWQFPEKLIPVVISNALEGKDIPIYGDGSNVRDWIFIDDHVDALLSIITKGRIGHSYCIGANNEKSNINCVKEICANLDILKPKKISYAKQINFVKDRLGHDKRYAINSSKIQTEIGWKPKFCFSEGIKITVKWYLDNMDWVKLMSLK